MKSRDSSSWPDLLSEISCNNPWQAFKDEVIVALVITSYDLSDQCIPHIILQRTYDRNLYKLYTCLTDM